MRQFLLAAALSCAAFAGNASAADGALDSTFGTDAEFPGYGFYVNPNGTPNFTLDYVGAVVKAADNKIWVVGRMKAPGAYRLSLTRTDADGYPDMDFGDSGLRTVVAPCTDFSVGDATLDAQGRLVVAINDCSDFTVYRFLPNGDLDLTLAGSGVLSVPFNQGGGDEDRSQKVATTPNGNLLIAGTVTTPTTRNLGIAHYTAAGLPVAGFGTAGKLTVPMEWSVPEIPGITGLYRMGDGRIVVTGHISETSQAISDKKQFVVRMLTNGAMDPSFGNVSAGLSKINLKSPLGLTESPRVYASLMESNGSVIQVGSMKSNQVSSAGDIFLLRWRPDGQLDTSIGANGVRQYALDFAGPNPADPDDNYDSASSIARQANGQYVIVASSRMGEYAATALVRLKRNFAVDTTFGNGGKIQHTIEVSTTSQHGQSADPILMQPGRIVVGGVVFTGTNGRMQMMMGMTHDAIFADTLE